jgi:hypothetical protein
MLAGKQYNYHLTGVKIKVQVDEVTCPNALKILVSLAEQIFFFFLNLLFLLIHKNCMH